MHSAKDWNKIERDEKKWADRCFRQNKYDTKKSDYSLSMKMKGKEKKISRLVFCL